MNDIPAELPPCPSCGSPYVYVDRTQYVCPECAHEWSITADEQDESDALIVHDANGNRLHDGDSVTVIKDLKLKGSSSVIKVGTKAKNIRLVEGDHDIDCKVAEHGAIKLKSQFVKKA
ncbi:MAG: zinc ribbon domain-containing protein YjdM [Pseudomonadota bacterium]